MTKAATAAATELPARFELLPIGEIIPSKTNPRTHFNDEYLQQLAASIVEKGIIEPLIVRPMRAKQEIVAGECRYRAAKIANQSHLPCIIRQLTDEQSLEIQIIENLHRKDLTPLEEASGFRALIKTNPDKHSATTIAARVGKSPSWVWDVMKLLDLVPEAKELLDQGRMNVNHAILIARLKPAEQKQVIDPHAGGLFVNETRLHFDGDESQSKHPYVDMKPVTVRELATWINDHVRFDAKQMAKAAPLQFEIVAAKLEEASARPGRGKKVIPITRDYHVQDSARDQSERTFGPRSWKRADGTKKTTEGGYGKPWADSPTCEQSVMGCVVVGPGQGEAFEVCIARDKCDIHWGKEIKGRAKNRKSANGNGKASTAASKWEEQQRKDREQREKREARWKVFYPALKKATYAKLETVPQDIPKPVFAKLLSSLKLDKGTKKTDLASALVRHLVNDAFRSSYSWNESQMVTWAQALGVNVKACEPKKEDSRRLESKTKARAVTAKS